MDHLVVVPHPTPIELEARSIRHNSVPDGAVGLGYYYDDRLIARSVVASNALDTIQSLLASPVSVALAAREDDSGNIDGRICLVLPVEPDAADGGEGEEGTAEPWRSSVPAPPPEVESDYAQSGGEDGGPQFALLPIGNVVRAADDRHHPDDVAHDAKEMLENLLAGGGRDAVQKAIDDLLKSI
ncbi:MAG: hypothetical protein GWM90_28485 [Gemmatimonadetes bacterium]|nr:hypothetical protein [Gemmatimonadota bacterium]NIQ58974.1 hypothetical protein [Gemmatimonadota bacterium]NIU79181.1 hypothetical protein [Gammaproteobacteria bacterium]NIX47865.1 hypothetical protein [Gemmatimonadota bacterium]NIY12236.1 hypothetical protein [Gemmatimonadota bacterium]